MPDNDTTRRRFLEATGAAAGAAALAGCAGGDGTPTPTAEPTPTSTPSGGDGGDGGDTPEDTATPTESEIDTGGQLNEINATISTFDPIRATDTASGVVIQNIFDGLTNYPNGESTPVNHLATGFETSNQFRTYTVTLKEGAQFHDTDEFDYDREVTAEDFVYSWERLAASPNSRRSRFILSVLNIVHETDSEGNYQPDSLELTATGDYELEFTLETAAHYTLAVLAYSSFYAIPDGILGVEPENEDQAKQTHQRFSTQSPVGCGPFEFDHWSQGEEVLINRYDDYHERPAYVDSVHWQVIEDDSAQYQYIQNRNADSFGIPTANYDPGKVSVETTDDLGRKIGTYGPLQNGDTVNYAKIPQLLTFYIGFNAKSVEKPARQAVAHVANQQQFAQQVFKSRAEPAYHLTPPLIYPGGGNAYRQHAENNYPYGYNQTQIDQAKQVMEDAGYGPNNKYEFTFTHYTSSSWSQLAQILRDRLGAAHIKMNIEQAEFSALLQRGRQGNLQAYSLGWIADWPSPDNFLQLLNPPQTDTSKQAPISYTNWLPEVESVDAAQRAEEAYNVVENNPQPTDEARQKREEAYVQIEEANWEDVIFLNTTHGSAEPMWYDYVHRPLYGAMGSSRQMRTDFWIEESAQE